MFCAWFNILIGSYAFGKLGRGSCLRLTFFFFWRQWVYWVCKLKLNIKHILLWEKALSHFHYLRICAPAAFFLITNSVLIFFQEALGRYLDMHELYHQYVNSKFGEPIEYSAYLDVFSDTDKIPRKMKMTRWILLSVELIWLSFLCILVFYEICIAFVQASNLLLFNLYRQYREYLQNLLEYLLYFFQRTEPLQDLDRIFSKVINVLRPMV